MINKTDMQQDLEKILLTKEEIDEKVQELGRELSDLYRGKEPVVVGILRGVVPRPWKFPCCRIL